MDGSGRGLAAFAARPGSGWADFAAWSGDGIRREVFFLRSNDVDLYASTYAADRPGSLGVVFCNAWGFEGSQLNRLVHRTSIAVARAGGVAFHFHYPGFGDSQGDPGEATVDVLAGAAADALREAARRHPAVSDWTLAGLRLGASVAALAADRAPAERLLLVQPLLRPGAYFERLERISRRSVGEPAPSEGFAHGYPLSPRVLAAAPRADAAVATALSSFTGEGAVVRYAAPAVVDCFPARFEQIVAPGRWGSGDVEQHPLVNAVGGRLRNQVAAVA